MKLLSVGGGSGGHVTPVLAVINNLAQLDPELSVTFVTDAAFLEQSKGLMKHAAVPVTVRTIAAGKFRRYKDVPIAEQLTHIPTVGRNLRDMFKVVIGALQSVWMILRHRPDVVFAKGGYVSLPVGWAAHLLRVPLVIHDSDARPGLTNTILARWATRVATGAPLENYHFREGQATYTGVPIDAAFHKFSAEEQRRARADIGIVDLTKKLVVVTGGGLGARDINDAVVEIAPELVAHGLSIYHVTGKGQYSVVEAKALRHADYHIVPFVYKDMARVLGAADVVVSRASATFLQELAALEKPSIIVPSSSLGDQVKNAEHYLESGAAVVLRDEELKTPDSLFDAIVKITTDEQFAQILSGKIAKLAKPDAARDTARLILEARK